MNDNYLLEERTVGIWTVFFYKKRKKGRKERRAEGRGKEKLEEIN